MRKFFLVALLIIFNVLPVQAIYYGGVEQNHIKGKVKQTRTVLKPMQGRQDYRAPLPAYVRKDQLRGYIGARFNKESGQLTYIYPHSDLNRLGVKEGAFIIKIDKALYRPCLMPDVSMHYADNYILLTIREGDNIRTVIVKLKTAKDLDIVEDLKNTPEGTYCGYHPRK